MHSLLVAGEQLHACGYKGDGRLGLGGPDGRGANIYDVGMDVCGAFKPQPVDVGGVIFGGRRLRQIACGDHHRHARAYARMQACEYVAFTRVVPTTVLLHLHLLDVTPAAWRWWRRRSRSSRGVRARTDGAATAVRRASLCQGASSFAPRRPWPSPSSRSARGATTRSRAAATAASTPSGWAAKVRKVRERGTPWHHTLRLAHYTIRDADTPITMCTIWLLYYTYQASWGSATSRTKPCRGRSCST